MVFIDNPQQYWQYYHQYRGSHVFISCLNHMQDVINTHVATPNKSEKNKFLIMLYSSVLLSYLVGSCYN